MAKPFIHSNILLRVGKTVVQDENSVTFEAAKIRAKNFANDILTQLFNKGEYGEIESHFNTERLNSTNFNTLREQIINLHFQREALSQEVKRFSDTQRQFMR